MKSCSDRPGPIAPSSAFSVLQVHRPSPKRIINSGEFSKLVSELPAPGNPALVHPLHIHTICRPELLPQNHSGNHQHQLQSFASFEFSLQINLNQALGGHENIPISNTAWSLRKKSLQALEMFITMNPISPVSRLWWEMHYLHFSLQEVWPYLWHTYEMRGTFVWYLEPNHVSQPWKPNVRYPWRGMMASGTPDDWGRVTWHGFSSGTEESGIGYNALHCGLRPVPQHCVHRMYRGKTTSPIKLQDAHSQFVAETYYNPYSHSPRNLEEGFATTTQLLLFIPQHFMKYNL